MITLLRAVFLLSVLMIMTVVTTVAFAAESSDMVTAAREMAVRGSSDFAPTQSQLYELGFVALIGLATLGV